MDAQPKKIKADRKQKKGSGGHSSSSAKRITLSTSTSPVALLSKEFSSPSSLTSTKGLLSSFALDGSPPPVEFKTTAPKFALRPSHSARGLNQHRHSISLHQTISESQPKDKNITSSPLLGTPSTLSPETSPTGRQLSHRPTARVRAQSATTRTNNTSGISSSGGLERQLSPSPYLSRKKTRVASRTKSNNKKMSGSLGTANNYPPPEQQFNLEDAMTEASSRPASGDGEMSDDDNQNLMSSQPHEGTTDYLGESDIVHGGTDDSSQPEHINTISSAAKRETIRDDPSKKNFDSLVKLLVLGDSAVGKSSLLLRFCDDKFEPNHVLTIGVDCKSKVIDCDGERVKIQMWDTAGQEKFRTITPVYFRSAMGVALVFDVTKIDTFNNVSYWLKVLSQTADESILKVLVGNKTDLTPRKVTTKAAMALAKKHDIKYFETSAKENFNVEEVFTTMGRTIREAQKLKKDENNNGPTTVKLSDSQDKSDGCCGVLFGKK